MDELHVLVVILRWEDVSNRTLQHHIVKWGKCWQYAELINFWQGNAWLMKLHFSYASLCLFGIKDMRWLLKISWFDWLLIPSVLCFLSVSVDLVAITVLAERPPPATTSLISDTFITFLCTTAHWHNCTNTHLHIWTSSHLLCTIYFICAECDCWWLCSSPPYTALLRALIMVIMTLEPMSRSTLVPIALLSPEWLCQVIRTLLMSPLNRCLRLERGSRWQFNETYLRLSLPLGQTAIFAKVPATFLIIRTGRQSIKYHFRYIIVQDI